MEKIEITAEDLLAVAKVRFTEQPEFALQAKCMALIRMLEEANHRYAELEAKCAELEGTSEGEGGE